MARMIQALLAIVVALFALTEHGCKKNCNKVYNDADKKLADVQGKPEKEKKICQETKEELQKCKIKEKGGIKTLGSVVKVLSTCKSRGIDLLSIVEKGHFMEVLEGHQVPSPKEEHGEREVHQVPSFKEEHEGHDEKAESDAKWEKESQRMPGGETQGQRMPGAVERHQAHLKIDS